MGAPKKKPAEQRLLELLGSPQYQPLNKAELGKRLQITISERAKFARSLADLETVGKITRIRKDRYVLPREADLMVGVIQVNPDGSGRPLYLN
jgi:ribonuclease R